MTVVITGAGSGIGAACGRALATDFIVSGYDQRVSVGESPAFLRRVNVTNPRDFECALAAEQSLWGLVACASLGPDEVDAVAVIQTNYFAALSNAGAFIPRALPGASVVLFSSIAAERITWDEDLVQPLLSAESWDDLQPKIIEQVRAMSDRDAYGLSKHLLQRATRKLGMLGLAHGVRVNCVVLGPVESPAVERVKLRRPDVWAELAKACRLGIPIPIQEVTGLVGWLLSAQSTHASGGLFRLDAGWALVQPDPQVG